MGGELELVARFADGERVAVRLPELVSAPADDLGRERALAVPRQSDRVAF